jgi:hypothetical protein
VTKLALINQRQVGKAQLHCFCPIISRARRRSPLNFLLLYECYQDLLKTQPLSVVGKGPPTVSEPFCRLKQPCHQVAVRVAGLMKILMGRLEATGPPCRLEQFHPPVGVWPSCNFNRRQVCSLISRALCSRASTNKFQVPFWNLRHKVDLVRFGSLSQAFIMAFTCIYLAYLNKSRPQSLPVTNRHIFGTQ